MPKENNKQSKTQQVTSTILASDYEKLKKIAALKGVSISELVKNYILQGMNVTNAKEDIDFIRKQIREELMLVMDKRLNWINAMYYRIGAYVVPMCRFVAEIVYRNIKLTDSQHEEFKDFWEKAKREGNQFISTGVGPLNSNKEKLTLEGLHERTEKVFGRKK